MGEPMRRTPGSRLPFHSTPLAPRLASQGGGNVTRAAGYAPARASAMARATAFNVFHDVTVTNAKYAQVQCREGVVPLGVGLRSSVVDRPVDLDDESPGRTVEVHDEASDHDLRAEANAEPVASQPLPEPLLRQRRRPTHRPRPRPEQGPPFGIRQPLHGRSPIDPTPVRVACPELLSPHAPPALRSEAGGRGGGVLGPARGGGVLGPARGGGVQRLAR